jgi:hypothetical protein
MHGSGVPHASTGLASAGGRNRGEFRITWALLVGADGLMIVAAVLTDRSVRNDD